VIIDFIEVEESQRWIVINDGVMGGISQSYLQRSPTATGIFSGIGIYTT
jgi:hypothetical protein